MITMLIFKMMIYIDSNLLCCEDISCVDKIMFNKTAMTFLEDDKKQKMTNDNQAMKHFDSRRAILRSQKFPFYCRSN